MASDPRFDPYGNEGVEPKQPRSKWTTCLIGCLVVFGVRDGGRHCRRGLGQLAIGATWLADVGSHGVNQGISRLRSAAAGKESK